MHGTTNIKFIGKVIYKTELFWNKGKRPELYGRVVIMGGLDGSEIKPVTSYCSWQVLAVMNDFAGGK